MELERVKDMDDVRHQTQLRRNELTDSHQVQNLDCDLELLRMV